MTKRELVVEALKMHIGLPYKWGGNDPIAGFDCSGLMVEVLQTVAKIERTKDYNADGLSKLYPETDILQPGVMVFYDWNNDGIIDHVEMIALVDEDGEVYTVGASGGDSTTTTAQAAIMSDAYVKMRPIIGGYLLANDPFDSSSK